MAQVYQKKEMNLSGKASIAKSFVEFRKNMSAETGFDLLNTLWSFSKKSEILKFNETSSETPFTKDSILKRDIAISQVDHFILPSITRFVAVSGSVAARTADENDDIDLFVVVRDYTSWIYRALTLFRAKEILRRKSDQEVNNKFCLNYIIEERFIKRLDRDLFIFHEIVMMHPLYENGINKSSFLQHFKDEFQIDYKIELPKKRIDLVKYLFIPPNFTAFAAQLLYMIFKIHSPNYLLLLKGLVLGEIRFYPKNFRKKILLEFYKS